MPKFKVKGFFILFLFQKCRTRTNWFHLMTLIFEFDGLVLNRMASSFQLNPICQMTGWRMPKSAVKVFFSLFLNCGLFQCRFNGSCIMVLNVELDSLFLDRKIFFLDLKSIYIRWQVEHAKFFSWRLFIFTRFLKCGLFQCRCNRSDDNDSYLWIW